jgi:hypothetical protein
MKSIAARCAAPPRRATAMSLALCVIAAACPALARADSLDRQPCDRKGATAQQLVQVGPRDDDQLVVTLVCVEDRDTGDLVWQGRYLAPVVANAPQPRR